eukprot:TRINITY_DN103397_c0_g1_i1.p1 TRINITY_DN103397_c0_g1~~TRINITY_DN103397_c0_g1_i1.p1  ORF type:complete len:616 (-),score=149.73 TRINITY_DN103397_c0_g1_i1:120-1967(-)
MALHCQGAKLLLCLALAFAWGHGASLDSCSQNVLALMERAESSFYAAASTMQGVSTCDCVLDTNSMNSPLHAVVSMASHGITEPGALLVLILKLVANRADLLAVNGQGSTALHLAAFHGQLYAVNAVLSVAGRNAVLWRLLAMQDASGSTPLSIALAWGHVGAARALARSGSRVVASRSSAHCVPALVEAVLVSKPQMLSTALKASTGGNSSGPDCLIQPDNGRGDTLLHLATQVLEYAQPEEAGREVLKLLLDGGANPTRADAKGDSAIIEAVRLDDQATVQLLLQFSSHSAMAATNKQQQTALHVAAMAGSISCLRLLVTSGAPLDVQDDKFMTPLDYAKQQGAPEAVRLIKTSEAIAAAEAAGLAHYGNSPNSTSSIFKNSGQWTQQDELGALALDEADRAAGISTESLAAGVVGGAVACLCCTLGFICWKRRSTATYKSAVVAAVPVVQEKPPTKVLDGGKDGRKKRAQPDQQAPAAALRNNSRSGSDSDGSEKRPRRLPSVVVHAGPRTPARSGPEQQNGFAKVDFPAWGSPDGLKSCIADFDSPASSTAMSPPKAKTKRPHAVQTRRLRAVATAGAESPPPEVVAEPKLKPKSKGRPKGGAKAAAVRSC